MKKQETRDLAIAILFLLTIITLFAFGNDYIKKSIQSCQQKHGYEYCQKTMA